MRLFIICGANIGAKLQKVESKTKEFILFLPRRSKFAKLLAKLLKKLVKAKRF